MIVVGNGESRKGISIPYHAVGCNAVHRDHEIEHLICVDQRCVREALDSHNTARSVIYTRPNIIKLFRTTVLKEVPAIPFEGTIRADLPQHWGSGGFALLLAAQMSDDIKLVGFDLWGNNNLINNIYKGTENYNTSNSRAVDPSYWIYQFSRVFKHYSDKYFTIYNNNNWSMPTEWNLANVKFKTLDTF